MRMNRTWAALMVAGVTLVYGTSRTVAGNVSIVNWGGGNGSKTFSFTAGGAQERYVAYSETTRIGGYTGAPIYGGLYQTNYHANSTSKNGFDIEGGAPGYGLHVTTWNNPNGHSYVPVFWKKADFANGGNTGTVTFDASSSISHTVWSGANYVWRAMVRDGSQWYVCATSGGITNPNGKNWYAYNPTTGDYRSMRLDTTVTASSHTFSNVTAIGLYADVSNYLSGDKFTATAIVTLPPKGTVILLR